MAPFLTKKASFYSESRAKSTEVLKCKNKPSTSDLHPKKLALGKLDLKHLPNHKPRNLAAIFKSKVSFYPEPKGESDELVKYQNQFSSKDL